MLEETDHQLQSIIDEATARPSDQTIKSLVLAISTPQNVSIRAKAYTALALILQHNQPQACTFLQVILQDSFLHSTQSKQICNGLKFLSAILLLSPQHALHIIRSDGFLSRLAASLKNFSNDADLNRSFSDFIALALNHKPVREIIQTNWPGCVTWLTQIASSTIPARCAASLALIKLRLTSDLEQKTLALPSLTELTRVVLNSLLTNDPLVTGTSIEALALVSHKSSPREILMNQSVPLLSLVKTQLVLSSKKNEEETLTETIRSNTSNEYGIATILVNITNYKVIKTDEDRAADHLKRLAQRSQDKNSEKSDQDQDDQEIDDKVVFDWIQGTLKRNDDLMDIVGWLVKSESKGVKRTTGKLILNLVERQELRGIILQCGGARMLMKVIATLTISDSHASQSGASPMTTPTNSGNPTLDPSDLPIIQALAKLLITTNPLLIFGPSNESPILLSTIKPLTTLFTHPSSTLLQTFEALMALTNLSSLGGRLTSSIAESKRVLSRLEECMMGIRTAENDLIRRASTELICNLSSTQSVLDHFLLEKTRLSLLIALCSSEDLPTALAASGSLAILTENSRKISQIILTESKLIESLSRVIINTIEDEDETSKQLGVQFRLLSLLVNLTEFQLSLSISSSSSQAFLNPQLNDCLIQFSKKLNSLNDSNHPDPQVVDLIKMIDFVLESSVKKNTTQSQTS